MARDRTILLPTPGGIVAPVLIETFLHKGAMVVVGKAFFDGVEGIFQHISVFLLTRC